MQDKINENTKRLEELEKALIGGKELLQALEGSTCKVINKTFYKKSGFVVKGEYRDWITYEIRKSEYFDDYKLNIEREEVIGIKSRNRVDVIEKVNHFIEYTTLSIKRLKDRLSFYESFNLDTFKKELVSLLEKHNALEEWNNIREEVRFLKN